MTITINNSKKGKAVEYLIISELLKNNFDVYIPVVDIEGIDLIIKNKEGAYVEVQVKSRTIKDEKEHFTLNEFKPKSNFFIVCHNITTNDFYVMPSTTFHYYAKDKMDKGKKRKYMAFSHISKFTDYKNGGGITLLEKSLATHKTERK